LQTGDVLDASNWELAKDLLPLEVLDHYRKGRTRRQTRPAGVAGVPVNLRMHQVDVGGRGPAVIRMHARRLRHSVDNPNVQTRITELFGIEHPIIQGGMHFVGRAELAAAVSNAGGLGIITGLTQKTPERLRAEISRCRTMTDKPFGVNLTFLPAVTPPDYPGFIQAIIDERVTIVETAGNNPQQWLPALKAAGIKVIHKCTSVRHSLKAERIGCDAVSVDGFECGGHPGEDDVPNMILLPRAAEELTIPFVASGGMADGRSLVAALALGADGINMGTRFIATKEAPVHDKVKHAIVAATELDTRLIMRPLRNTERVLRNDAVDRLLEKEKTLGSALRFEDIFGEVAGVYPQVMGEGDLDAGAWSCGMVVGLIRDVPTCQELIDRTMAEAETIIRERLARVIAERVPSPG
jgi:nitronate monooxygenase